MHATRVFLFVILGTGILMAQHNKVVTLSGFTVEINNKPQERAKYFEHDRRPCAIDLVGLRGRGLSVSYRISV
jgi:hypothetical protein